MNSTSFWRTRRLALGSVGIVLMLAAGCLSCLIDSPYDTPPPVSRPPTPSVPSEPTMCVRSLVYATVTKSGDTMMIAEIDTLTSDSVFILRTCLETGDTIQVVRDKQYTGFQVDSLYDDFNVRLFKFEWANIEIAVQREQLILALIDSLQKLTPPTGQGK